MPGEQFRTPYDADDELERCRRIREDESRRARAIVAAGKDEDARRFGTMQYNAGMMLLARVVRLLVQLELRRMK